MLNLFNRKYLNLIHRKFVIRNQSRNLRCLDRKKLINERRKETKVKLMNENHLESIIDRRFRRTQLGCALLNRVSFRFEVYKSRENKPFVKMSNLIVSQIREKSFVKYHNLAVLDEAHADKLIEIYSSKETQMMNEKFKALAEVNELRYLMEVTGKNEEELVKKGIIYNKHGCPKYGKWNNTMMPWLKKTNLHKGNYYNLLESKIYKPKFCLDLYPSNICDPSLRDITLLFFKKVFQRNLISKLPFNFYLTSYKSEEYDTFLKSTFREYLGYESNIPTFVDLDREYIGPKLIDDKKKLIVITRNSNKSLYFDEQANYVLPFFVDKDDLNANAEQFYIDVHRKRSDNVDFVSVPIGDFIDQDKNFTLNFAFEYYVIDSLKNGLNLKESIQNAFFNYNKMSIEIRALLSENRPSRPNTTHYQGAVKKLAFKHFDNLEKELC